MRLKKNAVACLLWAVPVVVGLTACTKETGFEDFGFAGQPGNAPGDVSGSGTDDGDAPDFDTAITEYAGQMADDGGLDIAGSDEDIYWEANSFKQTVSVTYSGSTATVTTTSGSILCRTDGAYVTVDMQTNSVKNVEIVVSGQSDDGQLKIYGEKKFKLTLSGVDLTCTRGPAINDQCKKRAFVHLTDGTTNRLTDGASYSAEPYYLSGSSSADEDRKGCFFSEGNLIFSGTGVLIVEGRQRHGIATDGYLYVRPGVTIAVTDAAKNAIHVKGDEDDGIGIYIAGGLVYANTSATAGKGMKTDLHAVVAGGQLLLSTSGGSEYDSDEQDTSSPACIKTDGNVSITGGRHVLKSTGTGGKGIKADGGITVSGGTTTVTTTGGKYVYNETRGLTSSPKGVRADGDITVSGGSLNICVTGVSDVSEGLESKSALTITGGSVYSYAYDDAVNAATAISISGGRVYAYGINNDGIDSNGSLTITGGLVIGVGTDSPEGGIDCDNSSRFRIDGGTVIAVGGTLQSNPSSASSQRSVVCSGLSVAKGETLCILDASGSPVMSFDMPRTVSSMSLLFSSSALVAGSYTVSAGGTLSDATDSWNGWSAGGTWTDGTQLCSFTSGSTVTTVGSTGGMGGGTPSDGPGGRP